MRKHNTIQSYLDAVAAEIRWKRAHPVVLSELRQHLEDQRDAFAEEGLEDAETWAIAEMGDPAVLGMELDRIHRPKPQWGLLILTIALALAGALLRILLTAGWSTDALRADPGKTMAAFVLGCAALLGGYFLDYTRLGRHAGKLYLGTLLLGVFALLFSPTVNSVPYCASYVTLIFPLIYAFWVNSCRSKGWLGLTFAILGGIPLALFCMIVPHLLGFVMLLLSGFAVLLTASWKDTFGVGRRKGVMLTISCAVVLLGIAMYGILFRGWWANWMDVLLHPELDANGAGYQAISIQKALGVSKWLGEGAWSTELSPYAYEVTVPGSSTDTFLTTLIYQLGWLPFLIVVGVFVVLMFWLLFRTFRQRSQSGRLLVVSVVLSLSIQAMISLVWNLGFPILGASFPFLVGNVHTVLNMGLIGLVLSVFRSDSIARDSVCRNAQGARFKIRVMVERV